MCLLVKNCWMNQDSIYHLSCWLFIESFLARKLSQHLFSCLIFILFLSLVKINWTLVEKPCSTCLKNSIFFATIRALPGLHFLKYINLYVLLRAASIQLSSTELTFKENGQLWVAIYPKVSKVCLYTGFCNFLKNSLEWWSGFEKKWKIICCC